jgi:hypothetical protein
LASRGNVTLTFTTAGRAGGRDNKGVRGVGTITNSGFAFPVPDVLTKELSYMNSKRWNDDAHSAAQTRGGAAAGWPPF